MTTVTIDEMQRDPLKYLQQVELGETLIIVKAKIPIAQLKPIEKQLRPFGLCAGEFKVPQDFDAPLPDDVFARSMSEDALLISEDALLISEDASSVKMSPGLMSEDYVLISEDASSVKTSTGSMSED